MPLCRRCGRSAAAGDRFCVACGARLDPVVPLSEPLPAPPPGTAPTGEARLAQAATGDAPPRSESQRGEAPALERGSRILRAVRAHGLLAALVAPALVAVAVAGAVVATRGSSSPAAESTQNAAAQSAPSTTTQPVPSATSRPAPTTTTEPVTTTTTTTTTTAQPPSSAVPRFQPVTASTPPGLLAALGTAVGSAYPANELVFTYEPDLADSGWLEWEVQGAPGYQQDVQQAAGFAHGTGTGWEVWGPGTDMVGCTGQGTLGPVPASVLAAFGVSCGSSAPAVASYQTYTNPRFGYATLWPSSFVAQPLAQDGSGESWKSPDGKVLVGASGFNNDASWSPRRDEAVESRGVDVTYSSIDGDVVTVSGYRNGGTTVVFTRDVVGSGSIDSLYWLYPASEAAEWGPVVTRTAQAFRPGDVTTGH